MHRGAFLLVCACSTATAPTTTTQSLVARPEPIDAQLAWSALQRNLPGRWTATTGTATVDVEFQAISRGSVVLELFGKPGRQTITTYHADGVGLVATHYCAQGNQPRLRAREASERGVVLVSSDATGVDPGEPVLVELSYAFDAGGFERVEIYRQPDGTLERTAWRYTRTP